MGHFHTKIRGEGKNREDAQEIAIDDFLWENGNRHSVREVNHGILIEKVPPMHNVTRKVGRHDMITAERNNDAPQDQWRQIWEFELHTHA